MTDLLNHNTIAEAMRSEGIHEIRYWIDYDGFTVKLTDGRSGRGKTIRQAIETATHERLAI